MGDHALNRQVTKRLYIAGLTAERERRFMSKRAARLRLDGSASNLALHEPTYWAKLLRFGVRNDRREKRGICEAVAQFG